MRYLVLGLMVIALVSAPIAYAQDVPVIVHFISDRTSITPDEAESGGAYTNLTWQTAYLRAGDTVHLQVLVSNAWHDTADGPQDTSGSFRWTIPHTLDFTPPTFRLVIRDVNGAIVATQVLTIPYQMPSEQPEITLFEANVTSLSPEQVAQPLLVTWHVRNRLPRANIVFQQILSDGTLRSIELPRPNVWVRSTGQGPVQPITTGDQLILRATLVNIDTGEIYVQRTLNVPIIGVAATEAVYYPPSAPSIPSNTQDNDVHIHDFHIYNEFPMLHDNVQVVWNVENASGVWINGTYYAPYDIPDGIYVDKSYNGAILLPTSELVATPGEHTIQMVARGANGSEDTAYFVLNVRTEPLPSQPHATVYSFTISPSHVTLTDTVTLSWSVRDTDQVIIGSFYSENPNGFLHTITIDQLASASSMIVPVSELVDAPGDYRVSLSAITNQPGWANGSWITFLFVTE